jgi:hypothetical protein
MERGVVTELEMSGALVGGGQYVLRYHKADETASGWIEISDTDAASWSGFRYQETQWSFIKFAAKPGMVVSFS